KVTQADFSPRTNHLANCGKSFLRQRVAADGGFPSTQNRDDIIWETVRSSAKGNQSLQDAFQAAGDDVVLKQLLIDYVGYVISGLCCDLKGKAKVAIAGHYGIPGKMSHSEIKESVRWLLEGSKFTREEVNVEKQQVTKTRPFSHPILSNIIRNQFFGK
ncbi:hypothetical protein BJV74DRAFT_723783, partial [Russula compacta]